MITQSVAVLGMRNGTSQSPFRPALGRQLVRAADAPLRGHGFGTSRLRQTPTTNGLTAYRMRLHLACVSSGTYGPFATSASRSRLRLPRTTRLALRASLAGSGGGRRTAEGAHLRPHAATPRRTTGPGTG